MLSSIWTGRTGITSSQIKMESISNNIANSGTTGYKKTEVSFSETLKQNIKTSNGVPFTSDRDMIHGTGVRASNSFRNLDQGVFITTGRDTDAAINGDGYFKVIDSKGEAFYTRDGNFSVDMSGNIVHNASGMMLEVAGIDKANVKQPLAIGPDGTIVCDKKTVGKINLYDFAYKNEMLSKGDNLFSAGDRPIATDAKIVAGYLEGSNVNMVDELTSMITTQRSYEFNARTIKAADEMWQMINNLKNR
ncbi:MAG: flagellar hook-basal body complex protein [Clostridium sp.]